ncbi:nuclear transport factor 2 family protein [Devosia sp.]|uniref:nuclear transport factor 2 family protein n=1 Tax=Devosia sp. TaxID=1871048 RepID=UPI003BAD6C7E
MTQLIDVVRAYFRGIEQGDLDAVLACYWHDALQIEWPNRLKSKGDRRLVGQLVADFARGQRILSSQTYEVQRFAETSDFVMVEVLWKGELAIPVGKLAPGDQMIAHSSIAFDFKDERIVSQRNYDCFEEF